MIGLLMALPGGKTLEARVAQARSGDDRAREDLIRDYTPFILKTASSVARRYLVMGRDDEVSVALAAFNEAINCYTSNEPGFLPFAATVIRRRLTDYYRKLNKIPETPLSSLTSEDDNGTRQVDTEALECYELDAWEAALERRDDIERWKKMLADFGISLSNLVRRAPRHEDARVRAMRIAVLVASDPELRARFMRDRRLPVEEIMKALPESGQVSRKTLERHREYISALALVAAGDFPSLREFLGITLDGAGGAL